MVMKPSPLPIPWTRHLQEGKDKEQFIAAVRNSTVIIERMVDMLHEDLRNLTRDEIEFLEDPESTEFEAKQTFRIGQKKQIFKWLNLLEGIYNDE